MDSEPSADVGEKAKELEDAREAARAKQIEDANLESEERIITTLQETLREKPYLNRELDARFKDMNRTIENYHGEVMRTVGEILSQTKKTNGSVASLKTWRGYFMGALGVLMVVVLPLLSWTLLQVFKNSTNITALTTQVRTILAK